MSFVSQCFDLVSGAGTAENESWICLNGNESENCFFLYQQQFGHPHFCSITEFATSCLLLLFSIPSNIYSVYIQWKQQVLPEFLLLAIVNAIINVALAFQVAFAGFTRFINDWIFGDSVCLVTYMFWMISTTMSMWAMSLSSYERKLCVCDPVMRNTTFTRLPEMVKILVILIFINISLWVYPFLALNVARTMDFSINDETIRICTIFTKTKIRYAADILYFLITFLLPVIFNIFNFW